MIDFIREFKFGRPQQIAALLLLTFIFLVTGFGLLHVHVQAKSVAVGISVDIEKYTPNIRGQIFAPVWILLTVFRLPTGLKLFLPALGFGLSLAGKRTSTVTRFMSYGLLSAVPVVALSAQKELA